MLLNFENGHRAPYAHIHVAHVLWTSSHELAHEILFLIGLEFVGLTCAEFGMESKVFLVTVVMSMFSCKCVGLGCRAIYHVYDIMGCCFRGVEICWLASCLEARQPYIRELMRGPYHSWYTSIYLECTHRDQVAFHLGHPRKKSLANGVQHMLCFRDETIQFKKLLPSTTIWTQEHAIVARQLLTYRDL